MCMKNIKNNKKINSDKRNVWKLQLLQLFLNINNDAHDYPHLK